MFIAEMTPQECRETLATTRIGRLACVQENQPYVVPISFAIDANDIYSFSMPGRKIDSMRENPRICLQVDRIERQDDWTSVVVFGRYEELLYTLDYLAERQRALELLQRSAIWWEPGAVPFPDRRELRESKPIFYRIQIESMTGRRGLPTGRDGPPSSSTRRGEGGAGP